MSKKSLKGEVAKEMTARKLMEETKSKQPGLFGEKDEARNTLTLEVKFLKDEQDAVQKRIKALGEREKELEGRIVKLSALLKSVNK